MTPDELAKARELLDAWQKGSAMEGDLAELRTLLPKVLEAAERAMKAPPAFDRGAYVDAKW
jgi:hypothetical protein